MKRPLKPIMTVQHQSGKTFIGKIESISSAGVVMTNFCTMEYETSSIEGGHPKLITTACEDPDVRLMGGMVVLHTPQMIMEQYGIAILELKEKQAEAAKSKENG